MPGVNKATRTLFAAADTPAAMLALGEAGVREHIKSINFNNTKAKNVVALSRRLVEDFGGEVPADIARARDPARRRPQDRERRRQRRLRHPRIAVDTHIFRVANRIPLARAATPLEMQEKLEARVPEEFLLHAHHWLILHGRYICKARLPGMLALPDHRFLPLRAEERPPDLGRGEEPLSRRRKPRKARRADDDPPPGERREAVPRHVVKKVRTTRSADTKAARKPTHDRADVVRPSGSCSS